MVGWSGWSRTWTFYEGEWREGNVPIIGVRSHAAWLASSVFDGARAFEGVAPDLDRHLTRINRSAASMYLKPMVDHERWIELAHEGINRFPAGAELYIRPMYWAEQTGVLSVAPDPEGTCWCMSVYDLPMPQAASFSLTLSPFRRPTAETMPVEAKAACLYPNNARAALEAKSRGFDNCLVRDMLGNIAESANSNVFLVRDGVVMTPAPNGTFLNGVTRQRVVALLRADGVQVLETTLGYPDFQAADEIFSTGNFAKLMPANRIDDRRLGVGPIYRRARALYWDFAHSRS